MKPLFIERSINREGEGLEGGVHDTNSSKFGSDSDDELDDITTGSDVANCVNITEGQDFPSFEDAFEQYVLYARTHGFAVRKQRTFNRDWGDKSVYRKDFVCFKACTGENKANQNEDSVYLTNETTGNDIGNIGCSNGNDDVGNSVHGNNGIENHQKSLEKQKNSKRSSKRCNCPTYMSVKEVTDGDLRVWRVHRFNDQHNHELLNQNEVRHLAAYRYISDQMKDRLLTLCEARVPVKQMMLILEKELSVGVGGLPFNSRDAYNFLRVAKTIKKNDADRLVLICKKLKEKDHDFQYEYVVDDENRLKHIAWSHSSSIHGYEHYGDVVVFDTTYKLNIYKMPVGIWVGVTNHGTSCVFGCCVLTNETAESFQWAFKVFVDFMSGKAPQTIITDQDRAIRDAIQIVLPNTKHALCMWHLGKKIPSWVGPRLGTKLNEFHYIFHKLNELETVEEFEVQWHSMIETYDLSSNKGLDKVYKIREQWAKPYLKSYFFAGMRTSNRCESMNAAIKKYVKSQTLLQDFIGQIGRVVELLDQSGEYKTVQQKVNNVRHLTKAPVEIQASKFLTPYAFDLFQKQLLESFQYASNLIEPGVWMVKRHGTVVGGRTVIHSESFDLISCTCREFEFCGIICRHALNVLLLRSNCFEIPDCYLPHRWQRESCVILPPVRIGPIGQRERTDALRLATSELIKEACLTEDRFAFAVETIKNSVIALKGMECPPILCCLPSFSVD